MNSYRQLRQPIPQVLASVALLFIGFSLLNYKFGLTLQETPTYLLITTLIELILVSIGFLLLFIKPKTSQVKLWYIYFLLSVSMCYVVIMSFFNMYFFVAIQSLNYVYIYWNIEFISMLVFFSINIISNIIMVKAKSMKGQYYSYIFRGIGCLLYIIFIILYFILPKEINNRFFIFRVNCNYSIFSSSFSIYVFNV